MQDHAWLEAMARSVHSTSLIPVDFGMKRATNVQWATVASIGVICIYGMQVKQISEPSQGIEPRNIPSTGNYGVT
jgi:hypothetical protein